MLQIMMMALYQGKSRIDPTLWAYTLVMTAPNKNT